MNLERASVLADRYEELGDADRADLIRTQLALETKPTWSVEHHTLSQRARRLLVGGQRRWIDELPTLDGARYTTFARGFVHGIELLAPVDLAEMWARVSEVVPLSHLEVHGRHLSHVPQLPGLQTLRVFGRIDEGDLDLKVLRDLRRLDLGWAQIDTDVLARLAEGGLGLRELDLGRHRLGDGVVPLVQSLASTLEVLRTRSTTRAVEFPTDAGVASWGPLEKLRTLDLGGSTRGLTDQGLGTLLSGLPALRSLTLVSVTLDDPALLDGLPLEELTVRHRGLPLNLELPNLKALRVAGAPCRIPSGLHDLSLSSTSEGQLEQVLEQDWPHLHTLELPGQELGDAVHRLAQTPLPSLRRLDVSDQRWTTLSALRSASWWSGLEQLRLASPQLHSGEVAKVVELMPNLTRLDLGGTNLDNTDIAGLGGLPLTDLRLRNQRRPEPVADLGRYRWRSLISLSLADCLLTNEHLDDWFGAPLPCLQQLNLSYNPLDDEILWGIRRRARELRTLEMFEVAQSPDAVERLTRAGLTERLWDLGWKDGMEIELRGRPLTYSSPF